ncbi:hypothetical protein CEXT_114881 [Caerostris extrusa]|uniref:Uncharacterized protein n=1 Tax=Caerostris extrusa TaxID=172846 RepID=A0AAV4SN64_CAEEX|nr:hypothetical protein CEXT_114881 [Caerostris extrusa]
MTADLSGPLHFLTKGWFSDACGNPSSIEDVLPPPPPPSPRTAKSSRTPVSSGDTENRATFDRCFDPFVRSMDRRPPIPPREREGRHRTLLHPGAPACEAIFNISSAEQRWGVYQHVKAERTGWHVFAFPFFSKCGERIENLFLQLLTKTPSPGPE